MLRSRSAKAPQARVIFGLMSKKRKIILGAVFITAIIGAIFAFQVGRLRHNISRIIFDPGKSNTVNLDGWKRLKTGLTQDDVIRLLGDSTSKNQISLKRDNFESTQQFWEYNYKSGVFQGPAPNAYVVYFNSEGVVTSFREPLKAK